ncbi:MAG: Loki-CTERM sorting domain-containing protein [Thermoplasmatota archaeon]
MKINKITTILLVIIFLVSGTAVVGNSESSGSDIQGYQINSNKKSKMYVLVNSTVYEPLRDELDTYKEDVESIKDLDVEIYNNTYSTPKQVRNFLIDGYENDNLVGAFFVGNLPYAEYKLYDDKFPIDHYYTDLDDTWNDKDGDGVLDEHEGPTNELRPEIWFGRISMKTDWEEEVDLYENYFDKVHRYRMGELRLPHKALQYVDDDWVNWTEEYNQGLEDLYQNLTVINDKETTNSSDYSERLQEGYEWIQVHCHANHSAKRHAFKLNDGPKGSGGNFNSRDLYENGQRSLFSNIFTCGSADYTVEDYLCGWYALTGNYGLASIGTTKPGGMLDFEDFYHPLLEGKSIGEAMKGWWRDNAESNKWWFYGMTTIGDPTLSPGYLYEENGNKDYIPHSPIRINGNDDFEDQAESQGWAGNGTEDDPYIIQGYGIDGGSSGNCIYIGNTTVHFVVKDCYLYEANGNEHKYHRNTGILLHDVENGILKENLIVDNKWNGIYLTKTDGALVERNTIKSSSRRGVKLNEDCFNNVFKNNDISFIGEYGRSVHLIDSDENKFINNNLSNNYQGFYNERSDSNNFTGNTVLSNEICGMILRYSSDNKIYDNEISSGSGINISYCEDTIVVRNRIYENKGGLSVHSSEDLYISSNFLSNNQGNFLGGCINLTFVNNTMINDGIDLVDIYFNELRNWNTHTIDTSNTVNGKPIYYWKNKEGGEIPSDAGQVILANCTEIKVTDLNLTNGYTGITLGYSDNNLIENNKINHNWGGITGLESDYNIFKNNEITENQVGGMGFQKNSDDNVIRDNNISSNGRIGMTFFDGCKDNKIYRNDISNHSDGISFRNGSDGNEVYHNNFIENDFQVSMFCGNNTWYNGTLQEGNYWSNYTGNDTNGDGIGEDPKYIMGNSDFSDKYPLMEPYSGEINNAPDKPSDPHPEDGAVDVDLYPVLSVNISDPDSDKLNVTFYDADDETVWFEATGVEIEELHGRIETMPLESLKEETTYRWYVEVSDGETSVKSDVWSFTTKKKDDTESPTADAGEDKTVKVDEEVTFDASDSSDNREITSYEWDFDDDTTANGETVTHKFDEKGTYEVKLTVTDEAGNTDTDTIKITVEKKDDKGIPGFNILLLMISVSVVTIYGYKKKK